METISLVVVRVTVYRSDNSHTDKKAKGGMMPMAQKENRKALALMEYHVGESGWLDPNSAPLLL